MKKLTDIKTPDEMRAEFTRVALGNFEQLFPEACTLMRLANDITNDDSHTLWAYSQESIENKLALLLHMSRYLRYESLMGSGAVVQLCDIIEKVYVEQPAVATAFSEGVLEFLKDNQQAQAHCAQFISAYELIKERVAAKFGVPPTPNAEGG